jgi:hypothetical protein
VRPRYFCPKCGAELRAVIRPLGHRPVWQAFLVILFADVVVKPLSAVLVLVWTWRSHTPWREIGYVRPKTWIGSMTIGVLFGVAFKFLMKAVVMPLLGADPVNQAYHFLWRATKRRFQEYSMR